QAAATPHRIALLHGDHHLAYGALNARANQFARHLAARGCGPERVAGLLLGKGANLVVALLGVLKAGAAFLPLDPGQSAARLRLMAEEAGCKVVLSEAEHEQRAQELGIEVVEMEGDWRQVSGEEATNLEVWMSAMNLAYIIYTSGSTGRPKGVMIEHR